MCIDPFLYTYICILTPSMYLIHTYIYYLEHGDGQADRAQEEGRLPGEARPLRKNQRKQHTQTGTHIY
jgi:hypothetical protein